jgi:hypothetical protein
MVFPSNTPFFIYFFNTTLASPLLFVSHWIVTKIGRKRRGFKEKSRERNDARERTERERVWFSITQLAINFHMKSTID